MNCKKKVVSHVEDGSKIPRAIPEKVDFGFRFSPSGVHNTSLFLCERNLGFDRTCLRKLVLHRKSSAFSIVSRGEVIPLEEGGLGPPDLRPGADRPCVFLEPLT